MHMVVSEGFTSSKPVIAMEDKTLPCGFLLVKQ